MRVNRVLIRPGFTQICFVYFDVEGAEFPFTSLEMATHSLVTPERGDDLEHGIILEGTDTPQGFTECRNVPFSLKDGADRWWIDLPRRCVPKGQIRLSAYTQTVRGESARQYSFDTVKLPGTHDLQGRAVAEPDLN